ncbi:16S rRNA (guanine(527)-N(7))-methyltransferase RsmG [Christensenella hongkongensis]|nr:16S rRNA (guanine(527)-N(7))-methyltransferase RsmG [Christensenella hongkongensis]
MMSEFIDELKTLCRQGGIEAGQDVLERMEEYYECMKETNRLYNLTAITEPKEAALKHFFDSIVPEGEIPGKSRVVDVGSGAGFPVVPLKILRGDISAFAVESSKKKCDFIVQGAQAAGIDVTVMNVRAEELATGKPRESYDVCVSRAVAQLRVLMELCAPLLKDGGRFLAYKGDYEKELNEAAGAMKALNLKLDKVIDMPGGELAHHVLVFHKTGMIAQKYPRRYAQIVKSPL